MANPLLGEIEIELNGINYTLKMSMNVIAQYEKSTGGDFIADAYTAMDAVLKAGEVSKDPTRYAAIMSRAVSRTNAAWLVYLAAKEANSQVEFGEIQEAFILDHDLTNENKFHATLFLQLAFFALNGEKVKKKDNSEPGLANQSEEKSK